MHYTLRLMGKEIINTDAYPDRPAAKATGYEYEASLRRLHLVGIDANSLFV